MVNKIKKLAQKLKIEYVLLAALRHPEKNPRIWSKEVMVQVEQSITRYGVVDPLVVNNAPWPRWRHTRRKSQV